MNSMCKNNTKTLYIQILKVNPFLGLIQKYFTGNKHIVNVSAGENKFHTFTENLQSSSYQSG